MPDERSRIRSEFERAAAHFAERTHGRFDDLSVVEFCGVESGNSVLEVGVGTGNFLSLFADVAGELIGVDLTRGMLAQARVRFPHMRLVVGDGAALPIRSSSIDLVTSAQTLHHIFEPLPVLLEMRRVAADGGRVLIVDQVATGRYEEVAARNELEALRDPSHGTARPPSAFRMLARAAGLEIVDERVVETTQRMSSWMAPGEFPEERFDAVNAFIETRGEETGMDFRKEGGEWVFTRRRIMLLAEQP
ncbi:MAG: class I SAM-dependent methyltransferase [Actinomycetota bacterium]